MLAVVAALLWRPMIDSIHERDFIFQFLTTMPHNQHAGGALDAYLREGLTSANRLAAILGDYFDPDKNLPA